MKIFFQRTFIAVAMLLPCLPALAQQLAVERFTRDDSDQAARIHSPRKDQNDKVCAIVKMETTLLLQDFTFDAGSVGIAHTEQKTGEIWVYLSPGARRITINHKHLGTVRNYEFGEALREATVYILKLKSGNVKTVVEDNVALQYLEMICEVEGATIKVDDEAPEPFVNGKFQKALSYGKHRYTVEAPMYHPESGIQEITVQKTAPVAVNLKPKFGKLTISTQPEQGAEVFIDDEKRGQSPLTIERLSSGTHSIRVIKAQFLPVTQSKVITDGATETLALTMQPNFAVITLTTPDGGDIYINDDKKGAAPWSGRLTPGQYKVEVRKPSHRNTVTTVVSEAGKDKTVPLEAPSPIYGSLEIKETNLVTADISIDGENRGTTPLILNRILVGSHTVELRAAGYKPYRQTVEIQEGKILPVSAELQEEEKTGSLKITANTSAAVSVGGTPIGYTPVTAKNLSLGEKTVFFQASGYKPLTKTVYIKPGSDNEIYGELKQKPVIHPVLLIDYRMSPPTSHFGFSLGYCERWGGYFQYRGDILKVGEKSLTESMLKEVDEDFSGGEKNHFRTSVTAGVMLRLFSSIYVSGGLGHGKYGAVYKVGKESDAVFYTAGLTKGLELEYGLTFRFWQFFSLTAGYSTIAGSDFGELYFGIGLMLWESTLKEISRK
ncbi:MAG: PEGA domain-containing protein [Prevotellaceae bacterium]|jgi:hypothetical protein|nr:PEGA domain-containing protein [Prevotellaceae bacterium]